MPRVFVPPLLRKFADDRREIEVAGETVMQVIAALEAQYPQLQNRLREGDRLKPGLAVAIGSSVGTKNLMDRVGPDSEVHFLPAIGGG